MIATEVPRGKTSAPNVFGLAFVGIEVVRKQALREFPAPEGPG